MSQWLKSVNTLLDQLDGEVENRIHQQVSYNGDDDDDDDADEVLANLSMDDDDDDSIEMDDNENYDENYEKVGLEAEDGMEGYDMDADANNASLSESTSVVMNNNNSSGSSPQEVNTTPEMGEEINEGGVQDLGNEDADASFFSVPEDMTRFQLEEKTDPSLDAVEEDYSEGGVPVEEFKGEGGKVSDSLAMKSDVDDTSGSRSNSPTLVEDAVVASEDLDDADIVEISENLSVPATQIRDKSITTDLNNVDGGESDNAKSQELMNVIAELRMEAEGKASEAAALQINLDSLTRRLESEMATNKKKYAALEKQVRKLSRTLQNKNSELSAAQEEINAQQNELYQAAERIEEEKSRYKAAIADLSDSHDLEMEGLKESHGIVVKELTEQLSKAEEERNDEVGNWERERDGELARISLLEEEKSTLESQIVSLEKQLDSAESRLQSTSSSATASSEREREAFEKLDSAFSIHAKQIAQRQKREAELEQEVRELSEALVALQRKGHENISTRAGQHTSDEKDVSLKVLRDEVEATKAALEQEKELNDTLRNELKSLSEERSREDAKALAKERQSDREAAELAKKISDLEAALESSELKYESARTKQMSLASNLSSDNSLQIRIDSLSEQVLRQQTKIESSSSETAALRQRLRVALNRADLAERTIAEMKSNSENEDGFVSIEDGYSSTKPTIRRRKVMGNTITSAIKINTRGDARQEKIVKAIDTVDKLSLEAGVYMRYNPLARAIFILYLAMLHLWTFALLVFHVHSEDVHGDFAGHGVGTLTVNEAHQRLP